MIDVMVQINNVDNGNPSNRIGGISITGFITLDPTVLPAPRFSISEKGISIHRKKFRFASQTGWVGNWCWDSLRMTETSAAAMLAHCVNQKWQEFRVWGVDSATGEAAIEISNRLIKGETVSAQDFIKAMEQEKVGAA